jgi:hypothetical protein
MLGDCNILGVRWWETKSMTKQQLYEKVLIIPVLVLGIIAFLSYCLIAPSAYDTFYSLL